MLGISDAIGSRTQIWEQRMNKRNRDVIICVTYSSNLHISYSERNTEWKMQSQIQWVTAGTRKYSFLHFFFFLFAWGSLKTSSYSICGISQYSDRQKKVRANVRQKQNSHLVFTNILSCQFQAVFKASRKAQAATRTIYIPTFKTAISLRNAPPFISPRATFNAPW